MTPEQVQAHQSRHGFLTDTMRSVEATKAALKPLRGSKQPNKTEAEFGLMLEARKRAGEFDRITFEGVKLRIAGNCYYAPDYMAFAYSGTGRYYVTFFEVKGGGPIRDDSIVKFKAAKELHPWADFEMWQKAKGEWRRLL